MAKIAFLGLGVMGYPMAGHLSKAGHEVTVYNRTQSRAKLWVEQYEGHLAPTPEEASKDKDFVLSCVGNDDDLREICIGKNGAFSSMKPGSTFIDHTTVSEKIVQELARTSQDLGLSFMDAPISGGQAGAENGQLVIMCGGDTQCFEKARPVLDVYSKKCGLMGAIGAGQLTKMVNQICIAGLVQGLSEGLHFAQKAGLDGNAVIDIIKGGAAGSWQMENRTATMLEDEFDHGFAVDWMRKDLEICLDASNENGANLPITALINQFYKEIQNSGGGRYDTSSLIKRLKSNLNS